MFTPSDMHLWAQKRLCDVFCGCTRLYCDCVTSSCLHVHMMLAVCVVLLWTAATASSIKQMHKQGHQTLGSNVHAGGRDHLECNNSEEVRWWAHVVLQHQACSQQCHQHYPLRQQERKSQGGGSMLARFSQSGVLSCFCCSSVTFLGPHCLGTCS